MRWAGLGLLAGCGAPAWQGGYTVTEITSAACYGLEVGDEVAVAGRGDSFDLTVAGGVWSCTLDDALGFACVGPTDGGQATAGTGDGSFSEGDAPTLDWLSSEEFAQETCELAFVATWARDPD